MSEELDSNPCFKTCIECIKHPIQLSYYPNFIICENISVIIFKMYLKLTKAKMKPHGVPNLTNYSEMQPKGSKFMPHNGDRNS